MMDTVPVGWAMSSPMKKCMTSSPFETVSKVAVSKIIEFKLLARRGTAPD